MRYPGLSATVGHMKRLALDGAADPRVRAAAIAITSKLPKDPLTGLPDRRDRDATARAVYDYVVRNIAYVRDPVETEWLQAPHVTLHAKAGDCDDHTMLSSALLGALGVRTRFRLVGSGNQPSHVMAEYETNSGDFAPFDTTLARGVGFFPDVPLGYDETTPPLQGLFALSTLDGATGERYEMTVGHVSDDLPEALPVVRTDMGQYRPIRPMLGSTPADQAQQAEAPAWLLALLGFAAGFMTARATEGPRLSLAKRI